MLATRRESNIARVPPATSATAATGSASGPGFGPIRYKGEPIPDVKQKLPCSFQPLEARPPLFAMWATDLDLFDYAPIDADLRG